MWREVTRGHPCGNALQWENITKTKTVVGCSQEDDTVRVKTDRKGSRCVWLGDGVGCRVWMEVGRLS